MQVAHIANIALTGTGGMGRIALEWKKAFEQQGHDFLHVGADEIRQGHPLFFGRNAAKFLQENKTKFDLLLAHEPAAGWFTGFGKPIVVFSHGIEQRAWQINKRFHFKPIGFKATLLPEGLRFLSNNIGFRQADLILLSNTEDQAYLQEKMPAVCSRVRIFKNGYYSFPTNDEPRDYRHYFFNASWIPRKGIQLLTEAFNRLMAAHESIRLTIAAGPCDPQRVLSNFAAGLHHRIRLSGVFNEETEGAVYRDAGIFVLPSFFEGQSLALTQAMARGLCPIAARNSGQNDLIRHRANGLLFETGNLDSFYDQLEYVLFNQKEARSMAENAASTVESYTWNMVSNEVVNWCEALVK